MPQKLMDPTGAGNFTDDQLEWFISWTKKNETDPEDGTVLRGDPLPDGFTFEEFQEHDSNPVLFGLYPMSGAQLENVGNKVPNRRERRQGQGQTRDGTDSMGMVAKALKAVRPVKCKDRDGNEHEVGGLVDQHGEQVGDSMNKKDLVRRLPDWQILEITDHIELVRVQQEKQGKN